MVKLLCFLVFVLPVRMSAFSNRSTIDEAFSSTLPAETRLLSNRLSFPDNCFIVDGYNGHVVGDKFYLAPIQKGVFLWPLHPAHQMQAYGSPGKGNFDKYSIQAMLGSEVGDPVIQELTGLSKPRNKVPMSSWAFALKPNGKLFLWHQFERVDHFSHENYSLRKEQIERRDRPWSGGNYPPMTVLSAGAGWSPGPFSAEFQWDKLWVWTYSPVSGRTYPWKGNGNTLSIGMLENFTLRGRAIIMDGILKSVDGNWQHLAIELLYQDSLNLNPARMAWRFSGAARQYKANVDSLLLPVSRTGFPVKAALDVRDTFQDSLIKIQLSAGGLFENKAWMANGELLVQEKAGQFLLTQKLAGFYWNPSVLWEPVKERITAGSSAFYNTDRRHRGARTEAQFAWRYRGTAVMAEGGLGCEWGVPYFKREAGFQQSGLLLRSGSVTGFSKPILNTANALSFKQSLPFGLDVGLKLKHRYFFENSDKRLDYLPSPWLLSIKAVYFTSSGLSLSMLSYYLGPKEVRHWTDFPFVIKKHWEHNLSLMQTLLNGRLKFHYTALYAFGKEIREHPAESPYAFRILIGSQMRF